MLECEREIGRKSTSKRERESAHTCVLAREGGRERRRESGRERGGRERERDLAPQLSAIDRVGVGQRRQTVPVDHEICRLVRPSAVFGIRQSTVECLWRPPPGTLTGCPPPHPLCTPTPSLCVSPRPFRYSTSLVFHNPLCFTHLWMPRNASTTPLISTDGHTHLAEVPI